MPKKESSKKSATKNERRDERRFFTRFASAVSRSAGHPLAFILSLTMIILWLVTGPLFHYNDTWQLTINTVTTVVTFLMVFIIQNTQNRDTAALQLKVDELIFVLKEADNEFLDLEDLEEEALDEVREEFRKNAALARKKSKKSS